MVLLSAKGVNEGSVSILIGGEAGQGLSRSGSLLGKALMRGGLHVFGSIDYPSVIRGSHNFYTLTVSGGEVHSNGDSVDIVLALNKETVLLHVDEVSPGGVIVYDEGVEISSEELGREDVLLLPFPLTMIVKEIGGPDVIRNTVALGAGLGLMDIGVEVMKAVISDVFAGRERIIEMNHAAIERGYVYAREHYADALSIELKPSGGSLDRIIVTGNEAVALGAIAAGCRFYAAYPMTPASAVLHYLISTEEVTGMTVVQTESEISALNMVVGASYAGVRAMTATSGGGFCLMTEALSLAAMTESPLVLMLGQRPGPSTGLATYTSQGDLLFAVHAAHGEFPRVVVAPGDVEECFHLTVEAFNLAERHQIQSIIITDKQVIESHKSTAAFEAVAGIDRGELEIVDEWKGEGEYKRYRITESGVSPRILPGARGATVFANSNEHNEYGYTTSDPMETVMMVDKRMRKGSSLRAEIEALSPVRVYGPEEAEVTLVGWGSTKGAALEAIKTLEGDGLKARFVQVVYIEPFPVEAIKAALGNGGRLLLIEGNKTAQLGQIIELNTGVAFENVLLKYDGRPFTPGDIAAKVREVL